MPFLKSNKIPISDMAHKYGFIIDKKDTPPSDNGHTYECFRATKHDDECVLTIYIETRDQYSSFTEEEEPYHNHITLSKDGKIISQKSYTFFQK
jgi:hypothetical protein